jgi:predicted nucleic acid-binding protein
MLRRGFHNHVGGALKARPCVGKRGGRAMAKIWVEMTQAEKIEDLRKDVLTIMGTVNTWVLAQQQLGGFHHDLVRKYSATSHTVPEVAEAVKDLEKKVAALSP